MRQSSMRQTEAIGIFAFTYLLHGIGLQWRFGGLTVPAEVILSVQFGARLNPRVSNTTVVLSICVFSIKFFYVEASSCSGMAENLQ